VFCNELPGDSLRRSKQGVYQKFLSVVGSQPTHCCPEILKLIYRIYLVNLVRVAGVARRTVIMAHSHNPDDSIPIPLRKEERHWTIPELSERWNFSRKTLYEWFRDAPGVLVMSRPERPYGSNSKRQYTSIRVPESVALRVYREHQNK
jgi:hypothetical protein